MSRDSRYFYFSGFLSLSFFSLIVFVFFYGLLNLKDAKIYALKKENFVSISLEIPKEESSSSKKNVDSPVKKEEPTPVVEKKSEVVETPKKDINIGNLFSSVVTKDPKKDTKKDEDKKSDSRVTEEVQRKSQKPSEEKKESLLSKVQSMNAQKTNEQDTKTSGGNEVNEYLAKIQAMVYDNFFPPANSQKKSVKVVIELNALGKVVDFRVLNYSDHDGLNQEVDKISERLKNLIFPKNPENKSQRITITLRPEDK